MIGSSLSRAIFTKGVNSRGADVIAERRWVAPATGEVGEASIQLPRDSPAASSMYVARGATVSILSEGGCGEWFGIIVDVDESDAGMLQLTAYQPGKLLGSRMVERLAALVNVSAGMGATVVLNESLSGVRGLSVLHGPFEGGVMPSRTFEPAGIAWDGLTSLMDATDGEVHITAGGEVTWCGPLAYATRYDTLLIDGGNLQNVTYQTSIQNRVSEVSSGGGSDAFTARSGDAAHDGWPGQTTIDGGAAAAQRELEARSQPSITISGGVGPDHWGIRERWFLSTLITRAEFEGRIHCCRVLARSLADGDELMNLELQVIQPVPATTITGGAGARQRPAQRATSDGQAGSFAQQFAGLKRLMWEMNFARQHGVSWDDFQRIHNGAGQFTPPSFP